MADTLPHTAKGLTALITRVYHILIIMVVTEITLDGVPHPTLALTFGHCEQIGDFYLLLFQVEHYG